MTPEELAASIKADILEMKGSLGSYVKESDMQLKFQSLEQKVIEAGQNKELSEQFKALETAMLEQGRVLSKLSKDNGEETKSIEELLFENKAAIEQAFDNKNKGVVTINANSILKNIVQSPTNLAPGLILSGIGQIPQRRPFIRNYFNAQSIGADSRNQIRYMEQTAVVSGTDVFAEGSALPEGVKPEWIERTETLKNIGLILPISEIALDNFAFINQEVNGLMRRNFDLVVERELWGGTGLTTHLKGLKTYALPFTVTGTPYEQNVNKIVLPGTVELIMVVQKIMEMNSLGTASEFNSGAWSPTVVFMNPVDALSMRLRKNKDGDIINLPFMTADGSRVGNVTIVESTLVDANTMLLADQSVFELYSGGMKMDIGWNADDYGKYQKSIRLYEHLFSLIRNLNKGGVIYVSSISDALGAITQSNS